MKFAAYFLYPLALRREFAGFIQSRPQLLAPLIKRHGFCAMLKTRARLIVFCCHERVELRAVRESVRQRNPILGITRIGCSKRLQKFDRSVVLPERIFTITS